MKREEEERLIKLVENLPRKKYIAKKKEEMLAAKMNGGQDSNGLDGMSGSEKDRKFIKGRVRQQKKDQQQTYWV